MPTPDDNGFTPGSGPWPGRGAGPDRGAHADDHLQDPALARALRNLDLPGPVAPAYSPGEVRQRGARRRTRRHAVWAGTGLAAAAAAVALVVGPLTPERAGKGPTAASQVESATPGPTAGVTQPPVSSTPSPVPSQPRVADAEPVAVYELANQQLITESANGANLDAVVTGVRTPLAHETLHPGDMLTVESKRAEFVFGSAVGLGTDYQIGSNWVVTLKAENGAEIHVLWPDCGTKCPPEKVKGFALLTTPNLASAETFYDAVDEGDRVLVVTELSQASTGATSNPKTSPTTTKPSSSAATGNSGSTVTPPGNNRPAYRSPDVSATSLSGRPTPSSSGLPVFRTP